MNLPNINIKVFIGLSIVFVLIFFITLFVNLSKSQTSKDSTNLLTPTSVDVSGNKTPLATTTPADFTGAMVEPIPTEMVDLVTQKQNLRKTLPLKLNTFDVDFDYGQDKFIVTLNTPKDQSLKDFQDWRTNNYPALNIGQFIIK